MSLRKGLALLLLTAFSLTSVIPAQAVTVNVTSTLGNTLNNVYFPDTATNAGQQTTANGARTISNEFDVNVVLGSSETGNLGAAAAATVLIFQDGWSEYTTANPQTAGNLSMMGINPPTGINGNNFAYLQKFGLQSATTATNTSANATDNHLLPTGATGAGLTILSPTQPTRAGCLPVSVASPAFTSAVFTAVADGTTFNIGGATLTAETNGSIDTQGEFSMDTGGAGLTRDSNTAAFAARAVNGVVASANEHMPSTATIAGLAGTPVISSAIRAFHVPNTRTVIFRSLPSLQATNNNATIQGLATTASVPGEIAFADATLGATNTIGSLNGTTSGLIALGGVVCAAVGGGTLTGPATIVIDPRLDIPATLTPGTGSLLASSLGNAIADGTNFTGTFQQFVVPNTGGTANTNLTTLNGDLFTIGDKVNANTSQEAVALNGTPSLVGSTLNTTSVSINSAGTTGNGTIRPHEVIIRSKRSDGTNPDLDQSFATSDANFTGAAPAAAGTLFSTPLTNATVYPNQSAIYNVNFSADNGATFTLTSVTIKLRSQGTSTTGNGRKGYLGSISNVTSNGTTAATAGDFGIIGLDDTTASDGDSIDEVNANTVPVVGTAAIGGIAGAGNDNQVTLTLNTANVTGFMAVTGDEGNASTNSLANVFLAPTDPNNNVSIGANGAANEADNVILSARFTGNQVQIIVHRTDVDEVGDQIAICANGTLTNVSSASADNTNVTAAVTGGHVGTTAQNATIATVVGTNGLDLTASFNDLQMVQLDPTGNQILIAGQTNGVTNHGNISLLNPAIINGGSTATQSIAGNLTNSTSVLAPVGSFVQDGSAAGVAALVRGGIKGIVGTNDGVEPTSVLTGGRPNIQNAWRAVLVTEATATSLSTLAGQFETFTSATDNSFRFCLKMPAGVDLHSRTTTGNAATGTAANVSPIVKILTTAGISLDTNAHVLVQSANRTADGIARVCFSLNNNGTATTDNNTIDSFLVAFSPDAIIAPSTLTTLQATLEARDFSNVSNEVSIGTVAMVDIAPNPLVALADTTVGATTTATVAGGFSGEVGSQPISLQIGGGNNGSVTTVNVANLLNTNARITNSSGSKVIRLAAAGGGLTTLPDIIVAENMPDAFPQQSQASATGTKVNTTFSDLLDNNGTTVRTVAGAGAGAGTPGTFTIRLVCNTVGTTCFGATVPTVSVEPVFNSTNGSRLRSNLVVGGTVVSGTGDSVTITLNSTLTTGFTTDGRILRDAIRISGLTLLNNGAAIQPNTNIKVEVRDNVGNVLYHSSAATFETIGGTNFPTPFVNTTLASQAADYQVDSDAADGDTAGAGAVTVVNPNTATPDNALISGDLATPGAEIAEDRAGTTTINQIAQNEVGLTTVEGDDNVGIPGTTTTAPIPGFAFVDVTNQNNAVSGGILANVSATDNNGTVISTANVITDFVNGDFNARVLATPDSVQNNVQVFTASGATRSQTFSFRAPAVGASAGATNQLSVNVAFPPNGFASRPGDLGYHLQVTSNDSTVSLSDCTFTFGGSPVGNISSGAGDVGNLLAAPTIAAGATTVALVCVRNGIDNTDGTGVQDDITVNVPVTYTVVAAGGNATGDTDLISFRSNRNRTRLVARGQSINGADFRLVGATNPNGIDPAVDSVRQKGDGVDRVRFEIDSISRDDFNTGSSRTGSGGFSMLCAYGELRSDCEVKRLNRRFSRGFL